MCICTSLINPIYKYNMVSALSIVTDEAFPRWPVGSVPYYSHFSVCLCNICFVFFLFVSPKIIYLRGIHHVYCSRDTISSLQICTLKIIHLVRRFYKCRTLTVRDVRMRETLQHSSFFFCCDSVDLNWIRCHFQFHTWFPLDWHARVYFKGVYALASTISRLTLSKYHIYFTTSTSDSHFLSWGLEELVNVKSSTAFWTRNPMLGMGCNE